MGQGLSCVVPCVLQLLDTVETNDIHSTSQLQSILSFEGLTITNGVVLIPADPEGYIQVRTAETYRSTVRAISKGGDGPTLVMVRIRSLLCCMVPV